MWDYLNANFEASIANSRLQRLVSLSTASIERKKARALGAEVVKAVSIFQIFGNRHGMRAEFEIVEAALNHVSRRDLAAAIEDLLSSKF